LRAQEGAVVVGDLEHVPCKSNIPLKIV